MRRIIFKQISDRKYLVDFTNLSNNFEGAISDRSRKADFIARNIGLADLLADISKAVTVWRGNSLYTGKLSEEFARSNGLKGGYFYNDGTRERYLDIWHGAVVSTNPADQIRNIDEPGLPTDMFEKANLDTVSEMETRKIQESCAKREKLLENTEEGSGKISIDYRYEEQYSKEKIERIGKIEFQKKSDQIDYNDRESEIIYESTSKEYPDMEISIPLYKENKFLFKVKNGAEMTIYEFDNTESLKKQINEEVKKKQNESMQIETIIFDETCSKETIDKYSTKNENKGLKKIVIKSGEPREILMQSTQDNSITDSTPGAETMEKAPANSNNKIELSKSTLTREGAKAITEKNSEISEIHLTECTIEQDSMLPFSEKLNKNLTKLDLSYSGFYSSELQYIKVFENLKNLNLSNTGESVSDHEVSSYIAELSKLEDLNLENTAVGDRGIESLTKIKILKNLTLSGTKITDTGLEKIQSLENLELLNLKDTAIEGTSLVNFKKLKNLDIRGTRITVDTYIKIKNALQVNNAKILVDDKILIDYATYQIIELTGKQREDFTIDDKGNISYKNKNIEEKIVIIDGKPSFNIEPIKLKLAKEDAKIAIPETLATTVKDISPDLEISDEEIKETPDGISGSCSVSYNGSIIGKVVIEKKKTGTTMTESVKYYDTKNSEKDKSYLNNQITEKKAEEERKAKKAEEERKANEAKAEKEKKAKENQKIEEEARNEIKKLVEEADNDLSIDENSYEIITTDKGSKYIKFSLYYKNEKIGYIDRWLKEDDNHNKICLYNTKNERIYNISKQEVPDKLKTMIPKEPEPKVENQGTYEMQTGKRHSSIF